MMRLCVAILFTLHTLLPASLALAGSRPELGERYSAPAEVGRELIGTRPAEWEFEAWEGSKPLKLADLKGKAVLVRWWTAPGCPYCAASAEALNGFAERYGGRGLVVLGAYHHKAATPLEPGHAKTEAGRLGFGFPVAVDREWKTLRKWWLDRVDRGWTSVTFLIGRDGRIAHIHGGGAFFNGEPGYDALERAIETALEANPQPK